MSIRTGLLVTAVLLAVLPTGPVAAQDADIWFPVAMPVTSYDDTWGAPRGENRTHEGTDVLAPQMHRVVAAQAGEIIKARGEDCPPDEPCSSYYLAIAGDDGRGYFYVHLNNDTPGRPAGCDGLGGVEHAFSPRLVEELDARGTLAGVRVAQGEHIGYVGSSGNAVCEVDQLHFEIWNDHDWGSTGKVNPHPSLVAAEQAGRTTPQGAQVDAGIIREAGADRISTAVALSRIGHNSAVHTIVAPADTYVPALLAAPLAAIDHAPVLLVPPDGPVPEQVTEEVRRLKSTRLTVIGSVATSTVEELARATQASVRWIQEENPIALSLEVADAIREAGGSTTRAVLAPLSEDPSRGWPDALMGSTLASYTFAPILLTERDDLPEAVADVVRGLASVDIVGGPAVISEAVADEVAARGPTVRRLAGADRLTTGLAVTEAILDGQDSASLNVLHLATASNFPDALAAGPAMYAVGSVLLLLDSPTNSSAVLDWVAGHRGQIATIHAIGGPAALTDDAVDAVIQQLNP